MNNQISKAVKLMACTILALATATHAQSGLALHPSTGGAFVTFDMPGAGPVANQGTIPDALNDSGTVAGFFIGSGYLYHGFVLGHDGNISTFDAPGPGSGFSQGTLRYGISPNGTIVGWFWDSKNIRHGFLRAPDGAFTVIDPALHNINTSGETSGFFNDANNVRHGVYRSSQGDITYFDVTGAGTASDQGTFVCPGCLNDFGVIPGRWIDSNNVAHGYVRSRLGHIETYDIPGAVGAGTWINNINDAGQIAGFWIDANNVAHAFIRDPKTRDLTTFDVPGAATASGRGTLGGRINNLGVMFGDYIDSAHISHAYLRSAPGKFTILDAPGARMHPGACTQAGDLIESELVTGPYIDYNLVQHGYLRVSALPRGSLNAAEPHRGLAHLKLEKGCS